MGRRKKNSITYDSRETQTFFGLIFLVVGILFLVSFLTVTEADNTTLFAQIKTIFNKSTPFTAMFLVLVGIKLLGVQVRFLKYASLFAQFVLMFLIAGLFTSLTGEPQDVIKMEPGETGGGKVGFFIVRQIFGDTIPTEPATTLIISLLIAILVPIAFTLSLSAIIEKTGQLLAFIKNLSGALFTTDDEEYEDEEPEQSMVPKASRFGDFNNYLKNKDEKKEEPEAEDTPEEVADRRKLIAEMQARKQLEATDVEFKESILGEEGLKQDELKYPDWKLPPLSLLHPFKITKTKEPSIKHNADIIEQILESFSIEAKVEDAYIGPSVVQYALNIPLGINVKKINNLSENIALALGVDSKAVRIESIPDTTYLGIEIPRSSRDMVRIKEMMSTELMMGSVADLPVPIGKDINGDPVVGDIQKMPHLLIAGATGSGKSVLTNGFITSLIMKKTPDELRMILVDPKQVEFMDYNGIAHLLDPVVTDMNEVIHYLKWAVGEMERRYTVLAKAQVRNIEGYNKKQGFSAMPFIVIVIDEMADMMMTANKVESETAIVRLAQKARAVGIHLILATQRPSVNVITGIIKANIPGRVAMSVTSSTDSRVILDRMGAESLMGKGDLLFKAPDKTKSTRLQCANIEQDEVARVVEFIKNQAPEVEYYNIAQQVKSMAVDDNIDGMADHSGDNLFEQAVRIVVQSNKGSSSYLQRRLNIGFNRAARLLEELEEAGVVGPTNGSKPREVLISDADGYIAQLKGLTS